MSQAMTAGRPRGAHRTSTHDGARITVSDLRSARVHRTTRPRPRPTPRPTHARPLPEAPREPAARSSFEVAARAWLDSRPFWAGLCLIVAGIQVGFWPAIGGTPSGVSQIMFLVLLVSDGLAVWLVPLYRRLLGVQAAALGVLAVTTANLGGLLLGTAAAILGGAMAFRWRPTAQGSAALSVERPLKAVPSVPDAAEPGDSADPEPEREVERTAELRPAPKLAVVPEEKDEESLIPGF